MWPFQKKNDLQLVIDNSRYKEKPVLLLFEIFVLDVIGRLTRGKRKSINDLNIKKIFSTKAEHWKPALREVLQLSNTIETAILNIWTGKIADNDDSDANLDIEQFSRDFTDLYFAENSQVDVWADGTLEKAQERISDYKKRGLLPIETS